MTGYLSFAVVMLSLPFGVAAAWTDRRPDPLRRPLAVFGLVLLASTLWSGHAGRLVAFCGLTSAYLITRMIRKADVAHLALAAVAAIIGAVEVIAIATADRGAGVLLNPNAAADLIMLTLPLPAVAATMILSRGALVGMAAMLMAAYRPRPIIAALAVVIGAAAVYGLYQMRPASVDSRLRTYAEAARLFAARPVFGWGADTYRSLATNEPGKDHADSAALTIAAEMGVIGLAAWAYLVGSVIVIAIRSKSELRLPLLAFGVHQLVDDTVWVPLVAVTLAVTIARMAEEGN